LGLLYGPTYFASWRARRFGFVEAFLRGGVVNYLGTPLPMKQPNACGDILQRATREKSVGEALLAGRNQVSADTKSIDRADYIPLRQLRLLKQGEGT
jgi:hypothetical protein